MMRFTHYRDNGDGTTTLFNVEACEHCGGTVRAPNSVGGIIKDAPTYHSLGIKEWKDALPPEQYWSDVLGGCACYGCLGGAS